MKGPKFILNRLKENFDVSEEKEQEGFPDMNYIVGNSSAMDIGEVPTPLDQRIGYASQIGGSLMELQITNPATFSLEGDKMIDVIEQLGIDVTLHPDMNAGFTTAYKSQAEGYGYDMVESYFTKYIQELALFKKRVERMGDGDEPLFNIGRMNPHISTTPMPSLSERMAQDVAVDPFGFEINDYDDNARKLRNRYNKNIYKNPEFLRRLYHTLFLEVSNYPFEQYQTFASYSKTFDEEWRKAQHKAAWQLFDEETDHLEDKLSTIRTTIQRDQGVSRGWFEILEERDIELERALPQYKPNVERNAPPPMGTITDYNGIESKDDKSSLKNALKALLDTDNLRAIRLRELETVLYQIDNLDIDDLKTEKIGDEDLDNQFNQDIGEQDFNSIKESLRNAINEALDQLWYNQESDDPEYQYISQDAKWSALQSHLEIQKIRIFENAYNIGIEEYGIEELAEEVFSGADKSLFDSNEREHIKDETEMHEDMLERLLTGQQFEREMWKESRIFYQIIPAWMSSSSEATENHEGWDAPEFIWNTLVKNKWEEIEGINLDLKDPRNGLGKGEDHYMDLLENNEKFRMDVAAAVGACYAWGHYTQRKVNFDLKGRDFGLSQEEVNEVESRGWTWIEWMNEFGLGVNLETMAGGPNQLFKVWRPKDIAVAAHAINMTAREELEDINPELDGRPAKFTIDMEHVATMGVPPEEEMELFIEQEKELAETDPELEIEEDKPLAKIMRQIHLMDPGVDAQRGTHHGAIERGDKQLYEWLYRFVEEGFTRNSEEQSTILFELAEHKGESSFMMRIMMNMIELGIEPDEVTVDNVDPSKDEYEDEREALIARFFGIDRANYSKEWAKIEEHAFDPLEGLLEAEQFDYTYSSMASIENDNNPRDYAGEEYK